MRKMAHFRWFPHEADQENGKRVQSSSLLHHNDFFPIKTASQGIHICYGPQQNEWKNNATTPLNKQNRQIALYALRKDVRLKLIRLDIATGCATHLLTKKLNQSMKQNTYRSVCQSSIREKLSFTLHLTLCTPLSISKAVCSRIITSSALISASYPSQGVWCSADR